jgi:hypothetical protein
MINAQVQVAYEGRFAHMKKLAALFAVPLGIGAMKILCRVALATALAALMVPDAALAQSSPVKVHAPAPKPANLDFEESEPGKVPAGWWATTAAVGYPAETSTERPKSGKQCAVLRAEGAHHQFGVLMQAVDATAYRGHRVRLRAALRAADGGEARMWMRVDRFGGRTGFFDNMYTRPVRSADWKDVETVFTVDDDAQSLQFGLLLEGGGKMFADAMALDDLGKLTVVAEPARPFAGRGAANVEAFARLLGYVRHPSDEAAATDWDAFTYEGVRQVEAASSPADLARRLEAVFLPVAPTLCVVPTGTKVELPGELVAPKGDATVVYWRNKGLGNGAAPGPKQTYASERVRAAIADRKLPDGFHDRGALMGRAATRASVAASPRSI